MLKSCLKIAWRNLRKDRQFTILNLVGLSTGLACTLLIYLWVTDEWSVDRFHAKDARLYQLLVNVNGRNGGVIGTAPQTPALLAQTLAKEMPGIDYGMIETLGMQMAAGRSFSREISSDSSEVIFNQAAILVAFPLAWWAANEWLQSFAYRIDISAAIFLIAGGAILLITLFTISFQAIKAAVANPIKSLRTE